jgi:hypothetical protein
MNYNGTTVNHAALRQNKESIMLENVRRWYYRNYTEITWFLVGFLICAGLDDFAKGDYTGAVLSFGIAWVNYFFSKR